MAPDTPVEHSQHIVVADYGNEAVYEIPNSALDTPAIITFTDVHRQFEVIESLKGSFEPSDTVYVTWDRRQPGDRRAGIQPS